MENKSLDGIKKLNKDELEKSRKIVLDYIGAAGKKIGGEEKKTAAEAESSVRAPALRPVESAGQFAPSPQRGIPAQDKPALPERFKKEADFSQSPKQNGPREMDGISGIKLSGLIRKSFFSKKTPIVSAGAEANKSRDEDKLKRADKSVIASKPQKEKKADKPEDISPKRVIGLFGGAFKKKTALKEEIKSIEKGPDKAKKLPPKGANKRKKKEPPGKEEKKKRLKPKRKISRGNFINTHKEKIKLSAYFATLAAILLIIFYIVFALSLLHFNFDTKLSRRITKYIPVPALVSKIGFVNYYDYKNFSSKEREEIKDAYNFIYYKEIMMMKSLILEDLAAKYDIPTRPGESLYSYNKVADKLRNKVITDSEINKVALSRINKIKQLIDAGGNFTEIGEKYSDELKEEDYITEDEAVKKFGPSIERLSPGQISSVIPAENGFYLVKLASKNDYSYKLRYIFIKAKTLEDYLIDKLGELKGWSLVN